MARTGEARGPQMTVRGACQRRVTPRVADVATRSVRRTAGRMRMGVMGAQFLARFSCPRRRPSCARRLRRHPGAPPSCTSFEGSHHAGRHRPLLTATLIHVRQEPPTLSFVRPRENARHPPGDSSTTRRQLAFGCPGPDVSPPDSHATYPSPPRGSVCKHTDRSQQRVEVRMGRAWGALQSGCKFVMLGAHARVV